MVPSQLAPVGHRWTLFVALAAIVGGSYVGWHYFATIKADAAVDPKTTAGQATVRAAIPVTVARVQKSDFPVYLNGLGTVQPYDTVTVRSRVDGQIIKVAFRQGQMVKEGDTLLQIDPRPYQAALDQVALQEGARRGEPKERKAQSRPLYQSGPEGLRLQATGRHATSDGRSVDRPDQGRSGSDRKRSNAARLHDHQGPAVGENRISA